MASRAKVRVVFVSAIMLLCLCAVATHLSLSYFRDGERWVNHTQDVRIVVGDLETTLNSASRERMSFLTSGDQDDLADYRRAVSQVPEQLRHLENSTRDNPIQVEHCAQLESVINARSRAWEDSIAEKQQGKPIPLPEILQQNIDFASRTASVAKQIRDEETRLLERRVPVAQQRLLLANGVGISSFVIAMFLLYLHYRLLSAELRAREKAERVAREAYTHEAALREDEERFRLFIDAVKDYAIFMLDPDGNISTWNEGAERLNGYKTEEILGQHFSRLRTAEDLEAGKPRRELEAAAREGRIEEEGWRVRKDGSRFWASVSITAIRDIDGKLIGFAKITRDFTERMRTQEAQREANAELAAEVSERKSAEQKLATSEGALRQLSFHLLRTQDEERRRIGRDLHDSLGQYLAVLKMNLDSLKLNQRVSLNGAAEEIENCVRLAADSMKELRTISYLLYPPMLEELGLKSAIPWYLDGFSKRSQIETTFEVDPNFDRLNREAELALFRILQEGLTNVHRHSGSSTATIRLAMAEGKAVLQIEDRGKGIQPVLLEQSGTDWTGFSGVGLRGMNERMRQLGGTLELNSTPDGTVVTASVPAEELSSATPKSA